MANVTFINPNIIRIKTSLTVEAIDACKEVKPELLEVKDSDGDVIFRVDYGRSPSVSRFGVCFTEVDGELIASVDFDVRKATSKWIASEIQFQLNTIEVAVENFMTELATIEIPTI